MTRKIGRNDPCICGSGKKYKYCCLRQESIQPSGRIRLPTGGEVDTFSEELTLGVLLSSSKEFQAFYKEERGKIDRPIYWLANSSLPQSWRLPEGINAEATRQRSPSNQFINLFITLRHIPATLEDTIVVAHELEHFVLDSEGFPGLAPTVSAQAFRILATALLSMIQDPVVNLRLQTYNFNLWRHYETELANTLRQIKQNRNLPYENSLARMHWIFNYVSTILKWEVARNETSDDNHRFQEYFDREHPDIAQQAQQLLALVKRIGYDTPQKHRPLLETIIQRYNLQRQMTVIVLNSA